jgi:hypothetical protein
VGTTGHRMDFLAIRRRSVTRLVRWKLADPGTLPLHQDEWLFQDDPWKEADLGT